MNTSLLEFLDREVRVRKDISHQEYEVVGINWNNDHILLSGDSGLFWAPAVDLDLIPKQEDDD